MSPPPGHVLIFHTGILPPLYGHVLILHISLLSPPPFLFLVKFKNLQAKHQQLLTPMIPQHLYLNSKM